MHSAGSTSYDQVLYPGHPYPQSYPDRLATLAMLHGLDPAPPHACHVLELGCGDGGNLIPLAFSNPQSRFLGVDIAAQAVDSGRQLIEKLQLTNIELRAADILETGADLGIFDYIIAHGIYSWVPDAVREEILEICSRNLAPNGVAYISYNANPAGHLREMTGRMMDFHTRGCGDPPLKTRQARAFLKFLADGAIGSGTYGAILSDAWSRLESVHDAVLYHDDLNPHKCSFYFYEFMTQAGAHGLQYLAEADFTEMQDMNFPEPVAARLADLDADPVLKDQYRDFLKGRAFRQTLLVHEAAQVRRDIDPEVIGQFSIASRAHCASENIDLSPGAEMEFKGLRGAAARTDHPGAKAAMLHLAREWPRSISYTELVDAATPSAEDVGNLKPILLQLYAAGLVEFHLAQPSFTLQPGDHPLASPLARIQAESSNIVTALNYASVLLQDTLSRQLLRLLDGTRDISAIHEDLVKLIRSGDATLSDSGQANGDIEATISIMTRQLADNLKKFARFPLLLA